MDSHQKMQEGLRLYDIIQSRSRDLEEFFWEVGDLELRSEGRCGIQYRHARRVSQAGASGLEPLKQEGTHDIQGPEDSL